MKFPEIIGGVPTFLQDLRGRLPPPPVAEPLTKRQVRQTQNEAATMQRQQDETSDMLRNEGTCSGTKVSVFR